MSRDRATEDLPSSQEEPERKRARQPLATSRRLFGYLRPFWKAMTLATICLAISSTAILIFPWVMQHLLDSVFVHHDYLLLDQIALLLIFVFTIRALFDFGQSYLVSYTGERLIANLRRQVYSHLQSLTIEFFNNRRTGDIMSRVTSDVIVFALPMKPSAHCKRIGLENDYPLASPSPTHARLTTRA